MGKQSVSEDVSMQIGVPRSTRNAQLLFLHLGTVLSVTLSRAELFLGRTQVSYFSTGSVSLLHAPWLLWLWGRGEFVQAHGIEMEHTRRMTLINMYVTCSSVCCIVLRICELCLDLLIDRLLLIDSVDLQQHRQVKCKLLVKLSVLSYCITVIQILNVFFLYVIHQITLDQISAIAENNWSIHYLLAVTYDTVIFAEVFAFIAQLPFGPQSSFGSWQLPAMICDFLLYPILDILHDSDFAELLLKQIITQLLIDQRREEADYFIEHRFVPLMERFQKKYPIEDALDRPRILQFLQLLLGWLWFNAAP